MARSLPPALTSALASPTQQPSIQVTLQDLVSRYSTYASGGPAGYPTCLVTNTGALLIAHVSQTGDPATAANTITLTRVTSPYPAAQFTAAPVTITSNASAQAGCALALSSGGSPVRIFYQRNTDTKLCYRDSADDGVTWGAEQVINTATFVANAQLCYGIAAADASSVLVACAIYANSGCILSRATYSGGAWSAWSNEGPTSPAWGFVRGLSCDHTTSGAVVYAAGVGTGTGPGNNGYLYGIGAWETVWSGANSYTAWTAVQGLDNPNLGLQTAPTIYRDASTNIYYATVLLVDSGSVSGGALTRCKVYTSTDLSSWTQLAELGSLFQYRAWALKLGGVFFVTDGTTTVILSQSGVGLGGQATPGAIDVGADVLQLHITETLNKEARCSIVLSNESGQYSNAVSLRADATISVSVGYAGTVVQIGTYQIDSVSYHTTPENREVAIEARCKLKLLDVATDKLVAFSGLTIGQLVQGLCSRAGLNPAALPGTAQFGQTLACFMVNVGETWLQALERAAAIYGFRFWCDEHPQLRVIEPQAGDASTWTYGTETLSISQTVSADQANVIRVVGVDGSGQTVFATVVDSAAALLAGRQQYMHVVDRQLDSSAKCAIRAGIVLRDEQMAAYGATITAALNPAHELGDVITVSDAYSGTVSKTARIVGQAVQCYPESGLFEHTLHLSGT